MAVYADPTLPIRPLTADDVGAMVDAGILREHDRVELLDGVLVEMSPQGDDHAFAIALLTEMLMPLAPPAGKRLISQSPVRLPDRTCQPEPDLAVVPRGGWGRYASDALLVIEVSVTSRSVDLGRKAAAYAAAGIPEYWVLDIPGRRLVVHGQPGQEGYASVDVVADDGRAACSALPLVLEVASVLPPRDAVA